MKRVSELLEQQFDNARKLQSLKQPHRGVRVNVVTDSIGKESLFGGVATALIFATLLCRQNGWTLRIVTRYLDCNLNDYYKFMDFMGIDPPENVQSHSDIRRNENVYNFKLPVSEEDVFLATSWWTAKGILDSNITNRILYIIQEEETFFYPYGDQRLLCEQIMNDERIDFIVNSGLLYEYLKDHGYDRLVKNALFFEPAFPSSIYHADENDSKEGCVKRKLFFYGRPKNPRNLYYFGLRCLDEAITQGIIDTDIWDIYMAGNAVEEIEFSSGYHPIVKGQMSWEEYAAFAREVDLSFSLMYTPHPSYPPLDMLSSGAVVVTNEFANKKELGYSDNMITKPLEVGAIVAGIREGIELVGNPQQRKSNYQNNRILRDWNESFGELLQTVGQMIKEKKYVCYR